MSESALYTGKVVHLRHQGRRHRLEYGVFSLLLDLDELPMLARRLRLFGYNRAGLFSFHDRDHGPGDGSDLRPHARRLLREAGIGDCDGPIRLLCYPRLFGYVFNPLSVFYCHDRQKRLRGLIYEVGNTFGERHNYVLAAQGGARPVIQECPKRFYVSPFIPMDCTYRFELGEPGRRLRLAIHETNDDGPLLDAWFSAERRALDDRQLLIAALRFPLMTFKVIAGIHWEALRLWLKGLPLYPHSAKAESTTQAIQNDPT